MSLLSFNDIYIFQLKLYGIFFLLATFPIKNIILILESIISLPTKLPQLFVSSRIWSD